MGCDPQDLMYQACNDEAQRAHSGVKQAGDPPTITSPPELTAVTGFAAEELPLLLLPHIQLVRRGEDGESCLPLTMRPLFRLPHSFRVGQSLWVAFYYRLPPTTN